MRQFLFSLLLLLTLTGCYYSHPNKVDHWTAPREGAVDSVNFFLAHHYWTGYNFQTTDSLSLRPELPMLGSSLISAPGLQLNKGDRIVVAAVRYVPTDSVDSVWVKVARDQLTQGWTREKTLMKNVVPNDPVSKFIYYFSDRRAILFLSCMLPALMFALWRMLRREKIRIVHFRDLPSFYPTLLCLCVSTSALIYGSIQRFVPETWIEFYFNPTLNPFSPTLPAILTMFIASVWLMLITACAVLDEVRRQPDLGDTLSYLTTLLGVCIVLYLIFTLTTPYYIGYVLYLAYVAFAIRQYVINKPSHLLCGNCGKSITHVGVCPHCGAQNK